jgi:REP element-mobilizing transposase RayT
MGYVKIWIHAVWTTKNRENYLNGNIRYDIFKHIKSYAEEKRICIDFINGYLDHVHCLISLNSDQNIADVMNLIKGESSHWINKNGLTEEKFAWQNDYYAASISKSHVERVRNYIRNQEIHHSGQTLDDEIEELFPGAPKPAKAKPRSAPPQPCAKARGN